MSNQQAPFRYDIVGSFLRKQELKEEMEKVYELFPRLKERCKQAAGSLSGGELKRIEIAMITARGTKLSIFDEPEAGIDLWSFQNLISVFERMRENTKGSILIISHQERILNIADEIVVIADGQISAQGSKDEILPKLLGTASAVDACSMFYKGEK